MKPTPGDVLLNRYRIDEELGRGGMAAVYKVWDNQRNVFLAMKMLREDLAEDKVFLRRFKREAQTLAALQHPNIVRFYGLEQEGLLAFMLMDYVDGVPLRREIFQRGEPFPPERLLAVAVPLCSALHYAHTEGRIHCDIKPGNILIDSAGHVLLSDFGIARMTDSATMTLAGAGTPAYMAPELVRGGEPTPQTDIYSLGVVLFEMTTGGERPFTGEQATVTGSTGEKVRWEQSHLDPPSPRRWNPALPAAAEAAILTCLAKQPAARYAGVLDLLNDLQDAFGADLHPAAASTPSQADADAPTLLESQPSSAHAAPSEEVPTQLDSQDEPTQLDAQDEPTQLDPGPPPPHAARTASPGLLLWTLFPAIGLVLGALLGWTVLNFLPTLPALILFTAMGLFFGLFQALALRLPPLKSIAWTIFTGAVWAGAALAEEALQTWLLDFLGSSRMLRISIFGAGATLSHQDAVEYIHPALMGLLTGLAGGALQAPLLRGQRKSWGWIPAAAIAWTFVRLGAALLLDDLHVELADMIGRTMQASLLYLPVLSGMAAGLLTFPVLRMILGKPPAARDGNRTVT